LNETELAEKRRLLGSYTRARTLGELVCERALGPLPDLAGLAVSHHRGKAVRLLYVGGDKPPGVAANPLDDSLELDFHDLHRLARRAARCLSRVGLERGDRVLLVLETGTAFVASFLGCQILGAIPVPVVPPWSSVRKNVHLERLAAVVAVAGAVAVVLTSEIQRALGRESTAAGLPRIVLASDVLGETEEFTGDPPNDRDAPAFFQFTSGSTGDPKGVVISQRALLANIVATGAAHGYGPTDCWCTWLPLFHDMGLVAYLLAPILRGGTTVLIPPAAFLRDPCSWLDAITRYGVTGSGGQDFGYKLCAERVSEERAAKLDLSRWKWAISGGELNREATQQAFMDRFRARGFREDAFVSAYGLAEMCLAVSTTQRGASRIDRIDRTRLESERVAVPSDDPLTVAVASVGRALPGHEIRVVGSSGETLGDRREGEIAVRGPSMMTGYYEDEEATRRAVPDGWLRTGDLGYLVGGELFVTGRTKEIVIKGGRNIHPYDVERAACTVAGVRPGRCAAFGILDTAAGSERLVVVYESERDDADMQDLTRRIRASIIQCVGIAPDEVRCVPRGTIRKTGSGKTQRVLLGILYRQGKLPPAEGLYGGPPKGRKEAS
jgi:acyl-CoA synthetase (AMP-forming)/AMP-acid ligase II